MRNKRTYLTTEAQRAKGRTYMLSTGFKPVMAFDKECGIARTPLGAERVLRRVLRGAGVIGKLTVEVIEDPASWSLGNVATVCTKTRETSPTKESIM